MTGTSEAFTTVDHARTVAARVSRDHATIRALLDGLERACAAAKARRAGGLDSFRRAVWDLYIAFEEHLRRSSAAPVRPATAGPSP